MLLTTDQQAYVALRAYWNFDLNVDIRVQDSVIYSGDGVDDLDRVYTVMTGTWPRSRFVLDVGTYTSSYQPCDAEDVLAIRRCFVSFYGTVNKPIFPDPNQDSAVIQLGVASW